MYKFRDIVDAVAVAVIVVSRRNEEIFWKEFLIFVSTNLFCVSLSCETQSHTTNGWKFTRYINHRQRMPSNRYIGVVVVISHWQCHRRTILRKTKRKKKMNSIRSASSQIKKEINRCQHQHQPLFLLLWNRRETETEEERKSAYQRQIFLNWTEFQLPHVNSCSFARSFSVHIYLSCCSVFFCRWKWISLFLRLPSVCVCVCSSECVAVYFSARNIVRDVSRCNCLTSIAYNTIELEAFHFHFLFRICSICNRS